MPRTKLTEEQARRHAEEQARFEIKKKITHKKICVYVPHPDVDGFWKSYRRMERKWARHQT